MLPFIIFVLINYTNFCSLYELRMYMLVVIAPFNTF